MTDTQHHARGVYVAQLPSGRYRATFRIPGNRQNKKRGRTFDTPEQAQEWGAAELERLRKLNQPPPAPMDLVGAALVHLRAAVLLLDAATTEGSQ